MPGDGTSLWVMTWHEDFAVGLLGLFGNPKAVGEAFHITSDEVLSWNQIYLEVYKALGVEPNIVHVASELIAAYDEHAVGSLIGDKVNSVAFDNSKIKHFVPEYNCQVNWAEGCRRTLAWFEAHPEFQTVDEDQNRLWDRILAAYGNAYPTKA